MIKIVDKKHSTDSGKWDLAKSSLATVLARKDLGFFRITERADLWQATEKAAEWAREKADDLVVVGIGGSSLGPKALEEVFRDPKNAKRIHFCDNVDAVEFQRIKSSIRDFKRTVWTFVSKSGSTIETLVTADLVFQEYAKLGIEPQCLVVSENVKNPLTEWAQARKFTCLEIPVDIGGRYSVFTAVGMLPMAFLGLNLADFRKGAEQALKADVVTETMTQVAQSFERQEWISFFWFYSGLYTHMGRWLQQLWAESLAKTTDRSGKPAARVSTPMWALGSSDQHSLLQQVMDGAKDKFVVFSRFQAVEATGEKVPQTMFPIQSFFNGHSMGQLLSAQAQGTRAALNEQKVSTMTLLVEGPHPQSLGFQMMFWQLVVAGLGEMLNINAFDQPGVELGKRLAKQILKS